MNQYSMNNYQFSAHANGFSEPVIQASNRTRMRSSTVTSGEDIRQGPSNESLSYNVAPFPYLNTDYGSGKYDVREDGYKMKERRYQRQRKKNFSPYSLNQHAKDSYNNNSSLLPTPESLHPPPESYIDTASATTSSYSNQSSTWSPSQVSFLPVETSMPQYKFSELSRDMWRIFDRNKQSTERHSQKMVLRDRLFDIIVKQFPYAGLYVVGSTVSKLCLINGDMDMCLMLINSELDQKTEAVSILRTIKRVLHKCNFLRNLILIAAKVPILTFEDKISGIEMDLNVNNIIGIRNTQLLSSYARIDRRFPALVIVIKLWARGHGINDAKHHTISSYSLVLMIIHYLQYKCKPPVLPNLQQMQPDKYLLDTDVRDLKLEEDLPDFISQNQLDLGDLFLGFLHYYGYELDYTRHAISVRLGRVIPKKEAKEGTLFPQNTPAQWKLLGIEEPFDRTNTARAVFNDNIFSYIKQTFRQSWGRLKRTSKLSSIVNFDRL